MCVIRGLVMESRAMSIVCWILKASGRQIYRSVRLFVALIGFPSNIFVAHGSEFIYWVSNKLKQQ